MTEKLQSMALKALMLKKKKKKVTFSTECNQHVLHDVENESSRDE